MKTLLSFAIALLLCCAALAADSEVVLEIAPTKEHPRNSEGSFATLKSGRIIFVYSQFSEGANDECPARIVSIFSADQGRTWSKEPEVVAQNDGKQNLMSVSLLRLKSGRLALFYLVKNSFHDCRPVVRFSDDEAKTWSKPKYVFTAPGYFVLNNDRVIQTSSGRLILPVAFHRVRTDNPKDHRTLDYRAITIWHWSDDEGKTWREAESWWGIPVQSRSGLQEPGVVELADGRIFSFLRTDQGCQYGSFSTNSGALWSPPQPTSIKAPTAPTSIKRLPASPDLLAVFNDHSGDFPFTKEKRTPLVAAISSDGGQTWHHKKPLENAPDSFYCYTAIHFVGDSVLFAYCAGEPKLAGLDRLRIRRVSLRWLTQ